MRVSVDEEAGMGKQTARWPPTFDDGSRKYCRRPRSFGQLPRQDAYARTPSRVRRLTGGGIELPACQLPTGSSPCTSLGANSSIMLRSYSSIVSILNTKPDWPSITASATSELSAALGHAVPGRARLDQPTHTVVIINGLADPVHDRLCPIRRCHDQDRDTASQRAAL
jgi:hypothetical protein